MASISTYRVPLTPDRFVYDHKRANQAKLSPDGQRIVYIVSGSSRETGKPESQVWILDVDGANQRQLTWRNTPHGNPIWSPDGDAIAFVSSSIERPGSAIFVLPLTGGEPREIVVHKASPSDLAWSPNGKTLAYILEVDPDNPAEVEPPFGELAPVRIVKRPDYKQDGRGFVNDVRQQLFLVDAETGVQRQVTSAPHDHTSPRWSPDGATVGVHRVHYHGLYQQVVLVDVAAGAEKVIGNDRHFIRDWLWTADGQSLLLLHGPHYVIGSTLSLHHLAAGKERTITRDFTWYAESLYGWLDETRVLLAGVQAGRGGMWTIDTAEGGSGEPVHVTPMAAFGQSFVTGHPSVVVAWNTGSRTGELAVHNLDTEQTTFITTLNDAFFADTPPAEVDHRTVENEGFTIDYWLTKPIDFDSTRRYPVVLDIHGGPHGSHGDGFNWAAQYLAAAGYLVVSPNPRGSLSYDDDFARAVIGDWGGGDWRDDIASLDDALTLPYADSDRTGIYGYSYGGYMSSWAIGQTTRFKAAVIGAPITDLIANYGTADIGHHGGEFQWGGRAQDIWDQMIAQSPITHVHKATTPSLLLHSEEDQRCPISGSEQLFISLLAAGVETEFVRYPGQSHLMPWFGPAEYRVDYATRLVAWFDRFLKP
jgi:dipeptidyl aminopeptidase/acylaminoacyl peptidase